MELKDKDVELLEDFWAGNLSESDRLALEKRLQTEPDFSSEADKLNLVREGLKVMKHREMKAQLQELEKNLPPISVPRPFEFKRVWYYATGVAATLLIGLGVWYLGVREVRPKMSPLLAAYFEPYPAIGITKGTSDENLKTNALRTYAVNDFKKAIPLLQRAFEVEKDSMLLFYEGIAYMGNGESLKAIPLFEKMQSSLSLPYESIDWYLALAYAETNQKEKALILLQKGTITEGVHQPKAVELRDKLK